MWIAWELYLTLNRPLTVLGPPHVVGSPTATSSPLFRSISGASWKDAESMSSSSEIGFGDFTIGAGVGAFRSKFWVAVAAVSLTTMFLTLGADRLRALT